MWYTKNYTEIMEMLLARYQQIKLHFNAEGKIAALETLQGKNWVAQPKMVNVLAQRDFPIFHPHTSFCIKIQK